MLFSIEQLSPKYKQRLLRSLKKFVKKLMTVKFNLKLGTKIGMQEKYFDIEEIIKYLKISYRPE